MDLVDTFDAFAVFIFVSLLFHLIALPINLAHSMAALVAEGNMHCCSCCCGATAA
jgi:hypothetical protein